MIENMGAHLNAYTSREQTVYYAKLFKSDVATGMEVLADILQNSVLDPGAVERERDVILREMEEVNKQREELILDLLHSAAYRGGGLGRTILGPEENIRKISNRDLRDYIQTHYTAPRTVVVAAGNVDHEEIVRLSEKHWSGLPRESRTAFATDFDPAKFTPTCVLQQASEAEEPRAHVAIAFEGSSWTDPFSVPLMVLQTIVGQWDRFNPVAGDAATSPCKLGRIMAESGACDSFMSFNTCYHDSGLFGFYIVAPAEGGGRAVTDVMKYLASLPDEGAFDDDDVERAKTQLKANIISQLDSLAHVCEEIGRQILTYQRRMPIAEVIARIDAVTTKEVRLAAEAFLRDQDHAMAAFGQVQHVPPFEACHIRNFTKKPWWS